MEIKSKFSEGDKVFYAGTNYSEKYVSCPDCLGTLKWTVVFADGEAVEVDCQTCKRGWEPSSGKIDIKEWRTHIDVLTIGSIRYDGSEIDGKQFSYMCNETGVGSGRIYRENELFLTEQEATEEADKKQQEQMVHIAQNNFSKKFGGTKEIEQSLESFGFSRQRQLEKVFQFRQWAKLSGIIKKK